MEAVHYQVTNYYISKFAMPRIKEQVTGVLSFIKENCCEKARNLEILKPFTR